MNQRRSNADDCVRRLSDFCIILIAMGCVYNIALAYPLLFAEMPSFWEAHRDDTFSDVLNAYKQVDYGWYRPTAFSLYFWVLSKFFSWRDMLAFRCASLMLLTTAVFLVYALVKRMFPRDALAPLFGALMFAAHPAVFISIYENTGFDYLYIIFILTASLCLVSITDEQTSIKRWLCVGAGVFFYVAALTSKELSFLFPMVAVLFFGFPYASQTAWRLEALKSPRNRARMVFVGGTVLVMGLYTVLHIWKMPEITGGYRNVFTLDPIVRNLKDLPAWSVHLFTKRHDSYGVVHFNALNKIWGGLLVLLTFGYWLTSLRHSLARRANYNQRAYSKLISGTWMEFVPLAGWLVVFMAIPVYSGGELWHISLATVGFATLFAVALSRLLGAIQTPRLQDALVSLSVAGVVLIGSYNFRAQFTGPRVLAMSRTTEVLTHPPVAFDEMPPGALIYYDNHGLTAWHFSNENLFRFVYQDPSIHSFPYNGDERKTAEAAIRWLTTPHAYFFDYDRYLRWHDLSSDYEKDAVDVTQKHLGALAAAGETESAREIAMAIERVRPSLLGPILPAGKPK